jgi:ubiquinone/menaquinone biosynthesis C-methylase UbiE
MSEDPIAEFKSKQRETWSLGNFGDVAVFTTMVAGQLVRFAGVPPGGKLLDVATGTGVVAITAARKGATVSALDLTPDLLAQARENAALAEVAVDWREGDAEALPFGDATFDVVLSQFGHMFAPRPEVAIREMLRVLKPGGRIAFATWPPDGFTGSTFQLSARYGPPLPPGVQAPVLWGDPKVVTERLGSAVKDLQFERGTMTVPMLSPQHYIAWQNAKIGPFIRMMGFLGKDPAKKAEYLREYRKLVDANLVDNLMRQEYLLSRAIKT